MPAEDAFAQNNPAIILLRLLREDKELREEVAARLGGKPELDEDSFFRAALAIEPPKGTA